MKAISEFPDAAQGNGSYSTSVAMASFAVGTILLLAYLISKDNFFIILGYLYVLVAVLVNVVVLLHLLYLLVIRTDERHALTIRILILLSNIPIALFYLYLLFSQPNLF